MLSTMHHHRLWESPLLRNLYESPMLWSLLWNSFKAYLVVEFIFFFVFRYYLVPRANQRTHRVTWRDYGQHRNLVIVRIIDRIYNTCLKEGTCIQDTADQYLRSWFLDLAPPPSVVEQPPKIALSEPESSPITVAAKSFFSQAASSWSLSSSSPSSPASSVAPPGLRASSSSIHEGLSRDELADVVVSADDKEDDKYDQLWKSNSLQGATKEEITAAIMRLYKAPPKPYALPIQEEMVDFIRDTCPARGQGPPHWTIEGILRDDMDDFMCWALFNKYPHELEDWEVAEVEESYRQLECRAGLVFQKGRSDRYKAVRMSLENVDYEQRPLFFYLLFAAARWLASMMLRLAGFTRQVDLATGVVGWFRPARDANADALLPLLFFHGIAPGGLLAYLPMMLYGILYDGRAAFLFENPAISFQIGFDAIMDDAMVDGVAAIVNRCIPADRGLSLCGHSFGSCPLTWLLVSPAFRHRIRQFVLLDPVTLLISDSDVIMNFLYPRGGMSHISIASSELFVQHYLRRNFSWCNAELWLEDIPADVQVIVGLAEKDEILNGTRVCEYLHVDANKETTRTLFWKGATHAFCVIWPSTWPTIKQNMMEQELILAQQQQQQS